MTPAINGRALVVDADPALFGLIEEWLGAQGLSVSEEPPRGSYDLIVVDVPYPRLGAPEFLRHIQREHPQTPVLALSSNFLPGVVSTGAVARELGVAGVLAKPLTRGALVGAVQKLLGPVAWR